jgi:alkyl sulfatase BDS1-like metallo-beta-lactamase superfamily hydrolase
MAGLGAEVLLPGHGLPIVGADRIHQALTDAALLLESIHDQALALMNDGARLDDVVHGVRLPQELLDRPYLRPIYDDPEFIVHNVWRLYGGWWDGDPAHLKPAPARALATELAELAGGAGRLAERAVALADAGELRVAAHLAELASQAAPEDAAVQQARARVFDARAAAEPSLMARSIFGWAAAESRASDSPH